MPAMALWEAGLLHRLMRIRFHPSFRGWSDALASQPGFAFAPLELDVVLASLDFEPNSDLFDVSIVATAVDRELPLITKDEAIVRSRAVEIHW